MFRFFLVFSSIFFSLNIFFLISNPNSLSTSLFPEPDQLIGFREWNGSSAKVQLIYPVDISFNEEEARVLIHDPGLADEMLVSNFPDFRAARWRPLQNDFIWKVEKDKPIITIYVVLKRKNQVTANFETTAVLHDTIDKNNLDNKIVLYPYGYYNWTLNQMNFITHYNGAADQSIKASQQKAEELSQLQFFYFINSLPIYKTFLGGDLLGNLKRSLRDFFFTMDTVNISYDSEGVTLEKRFLLSSTLRNFPENLPANQKERIFNINASRESSTPAPTFYGILKPSEKPITASSVYDGSLYNRLVIDTRGSFFDPSLFLKVKSSGGAEIINASLFSESSPKFVTYHKNLSKIKIDDNTLVISSVAINNYSSEITIANRYGLILKNDIKNLVLISNGNLHVIVD